MDYSCGNCGKDIIDIEAGVCPYCNSEFEIPDKSIPWEMRSTLGNVDAFSATFMLSMTKPVSFFRRLPAKGGFFNPMIYALICGLAGTLIDLAWQLLLPFNLFVEEELRSPSLNDEFYLIFALLSPLIIPLALIINTGMVHLLLFMGHGTGKRITDNKDFMLCLCHLKAICLQETGKYLRMVLKALKM